jgi:RNA recognition motif-containing protein
MATKLFVGNLSFNTTEGDILDLFKQAGNVSSCELIMDKFTNKSRGFAFVTMGTQDEATAAISQFNGKELDGRALTVNEARPREDRPRGGGGGGGFGGGGRERRDFGGGGRGGRR